MGEYIDALKRKGTKDVKVAEVRGSSTIKSQQDTCAECKKRLKKGYYKFIRDSKTGKDKVVCSDCLVQIKRK